MFSPAPSNFSVIVPARVSTAWNSSDHRHPERSGPIFPCAPQFGASGRVVEGSLCRFPLVLLSTCSPCPLWWVFFVLAPLSPFSLRPLCYLCGEAFAFLFLRHPYHPNSRSAQPPSSRAERPDFFLCAAVWRVGPRSRGIPLPLSPSSFFLCALRVLCGEYSLPLPRTARDASSLLFFLNLKLKT
jgi:hypothetical protein